jgi:hypothetical protein
MLTNPLDNYLQNYFNNFDNEFCIINNINKNKEDFNYSKFIKENENKRNQITAKEFLFDLVKKVETEVKYKKEGIIYIKFISID